MKKKFIPLFILFIGLVFALGLWAGALFETERRERHLEVQDNVQTTIAVVNADVGVVIDYEMQNFSSAVIDTLGDNFVLVSPSMAFLGLSEGTYGAVVTFPTQVSAQVLSFNTSHPERVRLDFQINQYLAERDYIEVYMQLLDLQQSVNTMLAHTFLSSVFNQFHIAQDQVDNIFANDLATLEALDIIHLRNFTETLQLDSLPYIPFNPTHLDMSVHLHTVTDMALGISDMYLSDFIRAAAHYLVMREALISLTDGFPEQKHEWLYALAGWTGLSVMYGEGLEYFAELSAEHMSGLNAWNYNWENWYDTLTSYHLSVFEFSEYMQYWFPVVEGWRETHFVYLENVAEYVVSLNQWRSEIANLDQIASEFEEWRTEIEKFIKSTHNDFLNVRNLFNSYVEISEPYWFALANWHTELDNVHEKFEQLETWNNYLQADVNTLRIAVANLPALPDMDLLTYYPELYKEEMAAWYDYFQIMWDAINSYIDSPILYQNFTLPVLLDRPDFDNTFANRLSPIGWDDDFYLSPPTHTIVDLIRPLDAPPAPQELMPPDFDIATLPIYPEIEVPELVPLIPQFYAELPTNPLVGPPPQPDDFWASLRLKHDLLLSFDINNYLTDSLRQQVYGMVGNFESYIDVIRGDAEHQFSDNVRLLSDVYLAHNFFLTDLRTDALQAESESLEHLHYLLETYYAITYSYSEDTRQRLSNFASMMPESRDAAGVNTQLIDFAVSPFELYSPAVRAELSRVEADHAMLQNALIVVTALFLITALGYLLKHCYNVSRANKINTEDKDIRRKHGGTRLTQ